MNIFNIIILVTAFCMIPAGVLWLCRKVPFLGKIGPVLILYLTGLIIGNSGLMPDQLPLVQDIMSNATVPLAIPLMLFGCTFRRNGTRSQILAMVTGLVSVILAVVAGYMIFGNSIEEGTKVGGLLTGVYTGGTINLAALKTMLNVQDETYILINSYDIIISFLYLTFLLTVGIRMFRKILPHDSTRLTSKDAEEIRKEMAKGEPVQRPVFKVRITSEQHTARSHTAYMRDCRRCGPCHAGRPVHDHLHTYAYDFGNRSFIHKEDS